MEFMVVEDFFQNFNNIKDEFKKIPRYEFADHPEGNTKMPNGETVPIEYHWPGARSEGLKQSHKFLVALFLKEFEDKFSNFVPIVGNMSFNIRTHMRLKKDTTADWKHKDTPQSKFSLLVYLSDTNLDSGTKLYDNDENEIADIKFVQNRAFIFNSDYTHAAIGQHGTNENDGRLTLNVFWR